MPKLKFRLSTVFLLIAVCASLLLAWMNHQRAERLAQELAAAEERLATASVVLSRLQETMPLFGFRELEPEYDMETLTVESEQNIPEASSDDDSATHY